MKIEIKNVLKLFAFLVCLLPVWTWAASYEVSTTKSVVDGNTFCGGSACTSSDTIIIKGGARGALLFRNFNGRGSYITIANENTNPNSKVEITSNGASGWGVLSLYNCKYVDLKGDNDGDLAYGIKVINDGTPTRSGSVWVYGKSDHIKISYLEIAFDRNRSIAGNGIQVQDGNLTSAWTFNNFEIHHNYIHDTRYAGMYLGHNNPGGENKPYVGTFSVHNNLLEDMGAYGITFKGVKAANNYIYNNTIRTTGIVRTDLSDDFKHGIGIQMFASGYTCEVYNNRIENTVGSALKMGGDGHLIHDNIILGCGSGNDARFGHGIRMYQYAENVEVYDNTILQAYRYGIYNSGGTSVRRSISHKRNRIGDCGSGEAGGTNLTEGTGADANIYYPDIADFNFSAWSDDGNYSNDDFSSRTSDKPIAPERLKVVTPLH